MIAAEVISQMPEVNWANALFAYGPLGLMCVWLMFRTERKLESLSTDVVTELRILGHRINGMSRALLADVAARDSTGEALRTLVNRELQKLEEEPEVRDMRTKAGQSARR